jgi:hypothetical protein
MALHNTLACCMATKTPLLLQGRLLPLLLLLLLLGAV